MPGKSRPQHLGCEPDPCKLVRNITIITIISYSIVNFPLSTRHPIIFLEEHSLVLEDGVINLLRGLVGPHESSMSKLAGGSLGLALDSYERARVQKAISRLIADLGGGEEKVLVFEDGWVPDRYLKVADENALRWVAAAICSSLDFNKIVMNAEDSSNETRNKRVEWSWEGLGRSLRGIPWNGSGTGKHVYIGRGDKDTVHAFKDRRASFVDPAVLGETVHFAGFTYDLDNDLLGPEKRKVLLWDSGILYCYSPSNGTLEKVAGSFPQDIVVAQNIPKNLAFSDMIVNVGCAYCAYMMSALTGSAVAVWSFLEGFSTGFEAMRSALEVCQDKHPTFGEVRQLFSTGDTHMMDSLAYTWSCRKAFVERCFQDTGSTATATSVTTASLEAICKLGETAPGNLLLRLHEQSDCPFKTQTFNSVEDGRGIIAAYIYASLKATANEAASRSVVTEKRSAKVKIVIAPYGTSLSVPASGCVLMSFPEEQMTILPWQIYQPFDGVNAMRLRDLPFVVRLLGFDHDRAVIDNLVNRLSERPYLLTRPYGPEFFEAIVTKWTGDTQSIAGMLRTLSTAGLIVPARCVREAVALLVSAGGYTTPADGDFPGYIKALEAWQRDPTKDTFRIRCDARIPFDGVVCSRLKNKTISLRQCDGPTSWLQLTGGTGVAITPSDRRLPAWRASMLATTMDGAAPEPFWETEELLTGSGKVEVIRGNQIETTGMVVLQEFMLG